MHYRIVESMKLALQTPYHDSNKPNFMKFVKVFLDCKIFLSSMAPFSNRCFGPDWFRAIFLGTTPLTHAKLNVIWASFLTPTQLSYRIDSNGKCYRFISYQPNLVAR